MDIVIPLATAFAALGLVLASAVWVNRRYSFPLPPPPPPPPPSTPEEMQWERERATLKLCLRHPYC
jgi:hypothetical protein